MVTYHLGLSTLTRHFVWRDDGVWCKKDKAGRLDPVNSNCERCAKPRIVEVTSGQNHDQRRPSEISPHVWWNMMTKAERI